MPDLNYFNNLEGEQLSSVEFVQDYLQLRFDGNTLTFFAWPLLVLDQTQYTIDDRDYRNMLCSLIGQKVNAILFDDKVLLQIIMLNGKIILPLLRDNVNKDVPELLHYTDLNNNWLVLD